jgi:RHS repeat-associated protein
MHGENKMNNINNIKGQYNYYPFGKQWEDLNLMANTNRYTFSGKEKQTVRDLGYLDFIARMYANSEIPMFTTQDPLAEKYYSVSPYVYCENNPINRIDPFGMDWYEDEDGNAMWRRTRDKEYTDDNGKIWKNIGTEYLLFDGNNLHYFQQNENDNGDLSLSVNSYGAVSGRPNSDGSFSYSEENQSKKDAGPIPEGLYSINPQNIQRWDDLSIANKFVSILGIRGAFRGGTVAWGKERVWIFPQSVSLIDQITGEKIVRDNFSIHGGNSPGSAGCIDLHKNAPDFFKRLFQSNSSFIRLNVLYQGFFQKFSDNGILKGFYYNKNKSIRWD